MIKSQKIILIIAALVVVGGASIFGILVAVNWGEYNHSENFYSSSPIEEINIESDIGAINIQYNTTPTDYYAKIELDIVIRGGFVSGKSFSNFFEPVIWQNESTPIARFELNAKSTTVFFLGLSRKINIYVTLRSDVMYNIDAFTSTGSIELNASSNKIINNTQLRTSTGSILFTSAINTSFLGTLDLRTSTGSISAYAVMTNFSYGLTTYSDTGSLTLSLTSCNINDDLVGTISTGSMTIDSYNTVYNKDCNWDFETSTGSIDVSITQLIEMNANITGDIQTSTGSIDVVYNDGLSSVGAQFTCSTSTGSITYTNLGAGGMNKVGGVVSTDDYNSASNKYIFSLDTSTGSIEVKGQSL